MVPVFNSKNEHYDMSCNKYISEKIIKYIHNCIFENIDHLVACYNIDKQNLPKKNTKKEIMKCIKDYCFDKEKPS